MSAKVSKKVNAVVVGKDSKAADKSKNKLKKQASKREEQREKEKDDAVVEISMDHVLTSASSTKPSGPKVTATPAADSADDSESDSEIEAQESALDLKGKVNGSGLKAFEQRDLVALAFAGDNVVQVCFEPFHVEPFLIFVLHRASRMRNGEKLPQMHQEKSTPPFLVGWVFFFGL